MHLKRLEIQGFKTFASRITIDFPPGVTAVIGPNGSGKTNVVDAVRWVLGEQSYTMLRCRRTEDLIFAGGKKRAPLGLAEVTLVIDNSDRLLPLPFNEVTITRRAHRSGENEYFINRSRVRLKDIAEATAPLAQSYTIVNQGLVDAALSLRPEERRGLFEDAAEVSLAVTRKAEAERRLREAETNLQRLGDLVAELEPRLRTLRRQARDAEQAHSLQDEISSLLRRHYLGQWREASTALEQAQHAVEIASRQLAAQKAQLEDCLAELSATRAKLHTQREALVALEADWQKLQAESRTIERELAIVRERREALGRQREEALSTLATLERQISEATIASQAGQAAIEQTSQKVEEARAELAATEASQQETRNERQAREQALAAAREAAFNAESSVTAQRNRLAELERRRADLQAELAAQEHEQQQAEEQVAAARAALQTAEERLQAAVAQHSAARAAEERAAAVVEQLREERVQLEQQAAAARRQADQLQSQIEALTRTQRSYAGIFAGVRAAMLWAEKSGRAGFKLVSSILRVPAELETAIEAALGSRLQQIVVERWEDAEAAIEQLRRSGAGRATFLPLDTLRPSRRGQIPQLPGVIGIASQLVGYDPPYERAIAQLLGRTLVAEDLPAARRALAQIQGGWTIVTLAGEQVASSGAVTGGALVKESGTLRRERELRELPGQLAQARQRVDQLADREQYITVQERTAHNARRQAEQQLREARQHEELQRDALATQRRVVERAEQELGWHAARQTATQHELEDLEQHEQTTNRALTRARAQAAQMTGQVSAAQEALGAQIATAQAAEEALLHARTTLSELESQLRSQCREVELHQSLLRQYTAQQHESQERLRTFDAERQRLEEQNQQAVERSSTLEQQMQQSSGSREALLQTIATIEEHASALEEQQRAFNAAALSAESDYGRASATLEGCSVRRNQIWERCAEEGIDIEEIAQQAREEGDADTHEPAPQLQTRIEQLRSRLRRMGEINPLAPAEFAEAAKRHAFLTAQINDARAAAQSLQHVIEELETTMRARFAETFEAVSREFNQAFTQLFVGGSAELQLLEGENGPQGIEIVAQPPGKRRQPLSLLSGGERALTSAALLFALLRVRPTPFCLLDEVDAALDESNVVRFRQLLLDLAEKTQFIIVTHNRGTVEVADTIYGVTMHSDGSSRLLSLRIEDLVADETGEISDSQGQHGSIAPIQ